MDIIKILLEIKVENVSTKLEEFINISRYINIIEI